MYLQITQIYFSQVVLIFYGGGYLFGTLLIEYHVYFKNMGDFYGIDEHIFPHFFFFHCLKSYAGDTVSLPKGRLRGFYYLRLLLVILSLHSVRFPHPFLLPVGEGVRRTVEGYELHEQRCFVVEVLFRRVRRAYAIRPYVYCWCGAVCDSINPKCTNKRRSISGWFVIYCCSFISNQLI